MKMTLYHVLGIESTATEADIAEAYTRRLTAMQTGPYDRNAEVMLKEAFAVLSNANKRALYDLSLRSVSTPKRPAAVAANPAEPTAGASQQMVIVKAVAIGVVLGAAGIGWFTRTKAPAVQVAEPRTVAVLSAPRSQPEPEPAAQVVRAIPANPVLGSEAELSSAALFAKLAPSVVRIDVSSGKDRSGAVGSGIVIATNTVITNCHVAQAGDTLRVTSEGQMYDAKLSLADEAHDLCKVDVPFLKAGPVAIGESADLHTGQRVVALGAPLGLDLTISDGIVSSLRQIDDGTLIQTTAPISPGSSGGGLFDMHGNLVGIVTFQAVRGQNLNFAAPSAWIGKMTATKGNGISSKLDRPRTESRADSPNKELSPSTDVLGHWTCRDIVRGRVFQIEVGPDGELELRRENTMRQGRWYLTGKRIEMRASGEPLVQVEYVDKHKLILYVGVGLRYACSHVGES